MEIGNEDDLNVAEQAYEWFVTLQDANCPQRAAFAGWLKKSPRHVGEFLAVTALHRQYADIDPRGDIDVDGLLRGASSNIIPLGGRQDGNARPRMPSGRRWAVAAVAAALLVVMAGWLLEGQLWNGRSYSNAVGEIRSFELKDGSVIYLNTRSRVQTRLSDNARDIQLLAGEALFKVAHDPGRPFRVHAGNTVIEAIGTQFNVRRRGDAATVAVLEGAVSVSSEAAASPPEKLVAGEGARIADNGSVSRLSHIDQTAVTAWRDRRLLFRDDSLAEIAAEFNRYNDKPRFRVDGAEAAAMRFTGVFDAEAPESFIRVIGSVGNLVAQREGDDVVIRAKGDESAR